jgi:hypothetical protein
LRRAVTGADVEPVKDPQALSPEGSSQRNSFHPAWKPSETSPIGPGDLKSACRATDDRGMIAPHSALVLALLLASTFSAAEVSPVVQDAAPHASAAQRAEPSLQLPRAHFEAGQSFHSSSASHSILKTQIIEAGRLVQTFDQVEDKSAEKTIDVLAVDEHGPTKLRVTYNALQFLQQQMLAEGADPKLLDAEAMSDVNPLEGRTFVLVADGASFRVLDAAEKPVSEGLAQLVCEEESLQRGAWLPAGRRLADELGGRTIALGASIDIAPDTARAFVDGLSDVDHVSMRLVPRVTRQVAGSRCAVFEAHLDIEDKGGGESQAIQATLAGEVYIDLATGRYVGAELAGPLVLGVSQHDLTNAVEVLGQGPWKISERFVTATKN